MLTGPIAELTVLGALAHLGHVLGPEISVGWRRSVGLKSLTGKTNKRTNFKTT